MKMIGREWKVTPAQSGFLLTEDTKAAEKRVLLANDQGLYECARDGSNKPLELIDCGPSRRALIAARLAEAETKAAAEKPAK